MKRNFIVVLLFLVGFETLEAQDFNESFFTEYSIDKNDSNHLYFRFENTNFFKNDEYFGDLTSGITYIGTFLQPKLVYYPSPKIKIEAGVHLLKYSGLDEFTQALPIFSFQYSPSKSISFIMGSIKSGLQHRIVEPMYAFENHLMNHVENGAQLLIDRKRFTADIWLDWEAFIFKTSFSQERIVGGMHLDYLVLAKAESQELKVDFQTIIAHKGGQFHSENDILQTLVNTAIGFKYLKFSNHKPHRSYGFESHYLSFFDRSPLPQLPYTMGYGVFSELFVNFKYWSARAGYWSGEYFISSKGNPLFSSISEKDKYFLLPESQLITAKIALRKQLFKDIVLEARFEPYFDMQQQQLEYSYAFYIIFNRNFFLKKIN